MLVFDNKKQYEKLICNGFEKYPNKRDLLILCNEWMIQGCELFNLKDKMIEFCRQWNSQFNYAKHEELFLSVINQIKKEQENGVAFQFNSNIKIFTQEINTIKNLKSLDLQKIAFIIICLAKWRSANYIYINSGSSIKLKDIFMLANVKATGKQQQMYLYELNSMGIIDVQLKPILKLFIPCILDTDEIEMELTVSDDMINRYLSVMLPHCERCGNLFDKHNNKQKYCPECAKIVVKEQKLSYWNKTRKIEN